MASKQLECAVPSVFTQTKQVSAMVRYKVCAQYTVVAASD